MSLARQFGILDDVKSATAGCTEIHYFFAYIFYVVVAVKIFFLPNMGLGMVKTKLKLK